MMIGVNKANQGIIAFWTDAADHPNISNNPSPDHARKSHMARGVHNDGRAKIAVRPVPKKPGCHFVAIPLAVTVDRRCQLFFVSDGRAIGRPSRHTGCPLLSITVRTQTSSVAFSRRKSTRVLLPTSLIVDGEEVGGFAELSGLQ
jgi:hypothetical protein